MNAEPTVPSPPILLKWIKHHADAAILLSLDIFIVALLFPFSWRAILLDAPVLLAAIWFYIAFLRAKKVGNSHKKHLAVGICLALPGIAIVLAAPFIICPKPAYVAVLPNSNPFASDLSILQSNGKNIGTLVLITDPIRKKLLSLLQPGLPASLRLLKSSVSHNVSYYTLPTLDHFVIDSPEEGEIAPKRSIFFPSTTIYRAAETRIFPDPSPPRMRDNRPDPTQAEVSLVTKGMIEGLGLVDFAYIQYPETIPWNAVSVRPDQESRTLTYAAYVDCAMQYLLAGESEDAAAAFGKAVSVLAPSNVEAARLATLQYLLAGSSLGGNVGRLQSLPLLHKAYDMLVASTNDPRNTDRDPLTQWIHEQLSAGYSAWPSMFPERETELRHTAQLAEQPRSQFEILGDALRPKSYDEILRFVKAGSKSPQELLFVKSSVTGRICKELLSHTEDLQRGTMHNVEYLRDWLANYDKALAIIAAIDSLLPAPLRAASFSSRMLSYISPGTNVLGIARQDYSVTWFLSPTNWDQLTDILGPFAALSDMLADGSRTFPLSTWLRGKEFPWWRIEYFQWFALWTTEALSEIDLKSKPWEERPFVAGFDLRSEITKHGVDGFIKDLDGRGRTFLPGVFYLAWYTRSFNIPGHEYLAREFQERTMIPLERYISTLNTVRPFLPESLSSH